MHQNRQIRRPASSTGPPTIRDAKSRRLTETRHATIGRFVKITPVEITAGWWLTQAPHPAQSPKRVSRKETPTTISTASRVTAGQGIPMSCCRTPNNSLRVGEYFSRTATGSQARITAPIQQSPPYEQDVYAPKSPPRASKPGIQRSTASSRLSQQPPDTRQSDIEPCRQIPSGRTGTKPDHDLVDVSGRQPMLEQPRPSGTRTTIGSRITVGVPHRVGQPVMQGCQLRQRVRISRH